MTIRERIQQAEQQRHMPDNVVRIERPQRRTTARWLEWTREHQHEVESGRDLTGYIRGEVA